MNPWRAEVTVNPAEATCLECDTAIPTGATCCPGCGVAVVFCGLSACRGAYPAAERFCPHCGAANLQVAATAAAATAAAATGVAPPPSKPSFSLVEAIGNAGGAASPAPAMTPPAAALEPAARPTPPGPASFAAPPMPTLPFAAPPLRLEMLVPRPPRKGEQCVVRLRATLFAASAPTVLDLVAACDVWPERHIALHAALAPGVAHEVPSLKFIPQTAGAEVARFEATLRGPEGIPIGRWSATRDWLVEDAAAVPGGITAEKGAMVIVGGSPLTGLSSLAMPLTGATASSWQPLPLQPDAAYHLRLQAACPAEAAGSPPGLDRARLWPAGAPMHAALAIEQPGTGQRTAVAMVCGASASFGRGGDPAVAWWLQPVPDNPAQHMRLSRRHTVVTLRAGRAWVSDRSVNGTRLNRVPIARDAPELLAQGDRLDLAGVVALTVTALAADRHGVHGVWLDRGDGWATRLRYLLMDGTAPVKFDDGPALWLAWVRGKEGEPLLTACTHPGGWSTIPRDKPATFGAYRLRWQPITAPCEQDTYLLTGV
jgi:hypothetical protein